MGRPLPSDPSQGTATDMFDLRTTPWLSLPSSPTPGAAASYLLCDSLCTCAPGEWAGGGGQRDMGLRSRDGGGMRRGTGVLRGGPPCDEGQIPCPQCPRAPAPCIFACLVQNTSPIFSSHFRRCVIPLPDVQVRKPRTVTCRGHRNREWDPRAKVLAVTMHQSHRSSHYQPHTWERWAFSSAHERWEQARRGTPTESVMPRLPSPTPSLPPVQAGPAPLASISLRGSLPQLWSTWPVSREAHSLLGPPLLPTSWPNFCFQADSLVAAGKSHRGNMLSNRFIPVASASTEPIEALLAPADFLTHCQSSGDALRSTRVALKMSSTLVRGNLNSFSRGLEHFPS